MRFLLDVDRYLDSMSDKRALATWPVWRSAWFCGGVVSAYLLFVLWLGPRLMARRGPFLLRRVIVLYNLLQVVANAYYTYKCAYLFNSSDEFSWWCQPMMFNREDKYGEDIFFLVRFYYALKILDLMDTVFFVLRKKRNQVTFLHVTHHVILVSLIWFGLRFYPGGTTLVTAAINCSVHAVMYTYYMLCALDVPAMNLIKPHITRMQLVQFAFNMLHITLSTTFGKCDSPRVFHYTVVGINSLFMYLFLAFYKRTYRPLGHRGFVRKVL